MFVKFLTMIVSNLSGSMEQELKIQRYRAYPVRADYRRNRVASSLNMACGVIFRLPFIDLIPGTGAAPSVPVRTRALNV